MEKLEKLNELYDGLKFRDAEYNEKTNVCTINFLYNPELFKPTDEIRSNITSILVEMIGSMVNIKLELISCPLDKHAIALYTYTTIANCFPSLSKGFSQNDISVSINGFNVVITLKLSASAYDYATEFNREDMVASKLAESFFADFTINFEKQDEQSSSGSFIEDNMELTQSIKEKEDKSVFYLSNIDDIIGKNEYSVAVDISKITSVVENVVICGEVTNIERRTYNKQYTHNNETKTIERNFYTFTIKNENKYLNCSMFPKLADESKGDLIEAGMKICCSGSFKEYRGKLTFTAESVARCDYHREEIKTTFKSVNKVYHTVIPEPYVDYEQADIFSQETKIIPGTYVVFDTETTGLESNIDEVIEIGACKVVDGSITETFSTFVKPNKPIPKDITALTGITNDMVKDAPSINYVLPDFYKFCDGSTIVGHNVAFDMGFIYKYAKKLSYNFDHKLMDTCSMAKEKLPGMKNYKLGTVVERLNIVLDNAHRAINDATATAKVFIKLF